MSAMRIKYDAHLMKLMQYFESATRSKLKDCFIDGNGILNFVVEGNLGLAIGKNGATFRKVQSSLKRKIRIVAFSESVEEFLKNFLQPLKVKGVSKVEDGTIIIKAEPESRGYVIGRGGSNLRVLEETARRYFDVKEIKVA